MGYVHINKRKFETSCSGIVSYQTCVGRTACKYNLKFDRPIIIGKKRLKAMLQRVKQKQKHIPKAE